MAKKKQKPEKGRSAAEQALKSDVKKLRAQLATAEKSAEKWKTKAKDHRSRAAGAKTELAGARRRLDKAEAAAAKWKDRVKTPAPPRAATSGTAGQAPQAGSASPDDSWNVTRLRAEARSRGVAGYSRKSREQLLVELRVRGI